MRRAVRQRILFYGGLVGAVGGLYLYLYQPVRIDLFPLPVPSPNPFVDPDEKEMRLWGTIFEAGLEAGERIDRGYGLAIRSTRLR